MAVPFGTQTLALLRSVIVAIGVLVHTLFSNVVNGVPYGKTMVQEFPSGALNVTVLSAENSRESWP
jgi:hypothetical protein